MPNSLASGGRAYSMNEIKAKAAASRVSTRAGTRPAPAVAGAPKAAGAAVKAPGATMRKLRTGGRPGAQSPERVSEEDA